MIKSTKKFSSEPKKRSKDEIGLWKKLSRFLEKMNFVSYMIWYHEIKDVFRVKQNNETYEERSIFLKKIQIVLLVCSTKIANFGETILIIPVYRYSFLV